MIDPRQGGAAAAVLADLPFDDLAALQVQGGLWGGGKGSVGALGVSVGKV
jgi:hypothetical protein